MDPTELEKLKEEKSRLENILKGLSKKTESERKLHIVKLLHEYNNVKDAAQVSHFFSFKRNNCS